MLNIDPIVDVNIHVGANSVVAGGVFDVGAILTPTAGTANGTGEGAVLSTTHRFASYSSMAEVANGVLNAAPSFGSETDVYALATKYFGVEPAPSRLVVIYYETAENTTDTPAIALADAIDRGADIYGVYYSPDSGETASATKANLLALASVLNSLETGMLFYGVTGDIGAGSGVLADGAVLVDMAGTSTKRAIGLYCGPAATGNVGDAAGLMGAAMGLSAANAEGAFALSYKSVATATPSDITQTQVDLIKAVNGNVYIRRTRTRAFIENGATASGLRFDEVLYLDRIAYDIQNELYTMIADSDTKLPQEDETTTLFINAVSGILNGYYNNDVLAEAPLRGAAIGGLEPGEIVERGYAVFADSFDTQSESDRAAHKAMPLTIVLCLSGSVETLVVNVYVQT